MDYSDSSKKTLREPMGKPDNAMGEPWGTMGNHGEHQKSKKILRGTMGKLDNAMGSHGEPWGTSKK